MTFRDDSWRDSYDAWKLATPPEYEGEEEDEPTGEESQAEIDDTDDRLERAFAKLSETALAMKAENARFKAALRKIAHLARIDRPRFVAIAREALDSADEPRF